MTQPLSLKAPAADRIAGAVGPFLIAVVVIALAVMFHQFAAPLKFNEAAFQNLGTVFAPLFAIAAFIERAVEVLVTPYRAGHSDVLQQRLVNIAGDPAQAAVADELRERIVAYKAESQQIAFRLATAIGMASSVVGVRGVASLLAKDAGPQPFAFQLFDVLLTGLLVGGGADGIHKVVTAVTSYLDGIGKTAASAQPALPAPAPPK